MEISYLGHSSFRIKAKDITLVTDPFGSQKADVVTVSHPHSDHSFVSGITGPVSRSEVFVINRPGEYEIGGVEVRAMTTLNNLIMVVRIDEVFVVHLGDLSHELSEKRIEDIGTVDVLMIPVGGEVTLDAKMAAAVVAQLEPSIVIPMDNGGVEAFLKVMGETHTTENKLKITKDSLPENTQVIVMEV